MASILNSEKNIDNLFRRRDKQAPETINKCIDILQNPSDKLDLNVNAFVFLCYRYLEGNFLDFKLLEKNFEGFLEYAEAINQDHLKARWKSSLVTGYCYAYIKERDCDANIIEIAKLGCDLYLVRNWPDIMFNTLACCLIVIAYAMKQQDCETANIYEDQAILLFKESNNKIDVRGDHTIADIVYSTSVVLGVCIKFSCLTGNKRMNFYDGKYEEESLSYLSGFYSLRGINEKHLYNTCVKVIPELEMGLIVRFLSKYQHLWLTLLPRDFDVEGYREFNPQIANQSDDWLRDHYIKHGQYENKIYRVELPEDFDVDSYRDLNKDISNQSDSWLKVHFFLHGQKEGRSYNKQ